MSTKLIPRFLRLWKVYVNRLFLLGLLLRRDILKEFYKKKTQRTIKKYENMIKIAVVKDDNTNVSIWAPVFYGPFFNFKTVFLTNFVVLFVALNEQLHWVLKPIFFTFFWTLRNLGDKIFWDLALYL